MAKVRFADGSRSIGGIPVKKTTGSGRGTFFNRMKWATLVVVLSGVVGGVPVPNPNPAPAPAHFEPSGPNVPGFGKSTYCGYLSRSCNGADNHSFDLVTFMSYSRR